MKSIRTFASFILVGVAAMSGAQVARSPIHVRGRAPAPVNSQALGAMQRDLQAAIASMTSALPIYDGNRVKSIHAAHRALVAVDKALAGPQAAVRTKPQVTDHVASTTAHHKYTQAQIATSQQEMEAGLASLNAAAADMNASGTVGSNSRATRVSNLLKQAIGYATIAIKIHSNQG